MDTHLMVCLPDMSAIRFPSANVWFVDRARTVAFEIQFPFVKFKQKSFLIKKILRARKWCSLDDYQHCCTNFRIMGGRFKSNGTTSVPKSVPRLMLDKVRQRFLSESSHCSSMVSTAACYWASNPGKGKNLLISD